MRNEFILIFHGCFKKKQDIKEASLHLNEIVFFVDVSLKETISPKTPIGILDTLAKLLC